MESQLDVRGLKQMLDAGKDVVLLDVREAQEVALCALPGHRHIPIMEVPARLREIPRDRPVVVYCHVGHRSAQVTYFLRQRGWTNVANLEGGIDAWSREIDPAVARY